MNESVSVGKGSLDGKGVYAGRDFIKDEVVVHYSLSPLTTREYCALPEEEKQFVHQHHGMYMLYGIPERYVNHSDDPNTYQDITLGADIALRDIAQGEMITTDASKDEVD